MMKIKKALTVGIAAAMLALCVACAAGGRTLIASKDMDANEQNLVNQTTTIVWKDENTISSIKNELTFSDGESAKAVYDELALRIGDGEGYNLTLSGSVITYNEPISDANAARPYASVHGQYSSSGWDITTK